MISPAAILRPSCERTDDSLGAAPVEGVMQPGFLDPEGLVRQVPGTVAMPFGREEVRVVFFYRVPVARFGLN